MKKIALIAITCLIMTALLFGCGSGDSANTIQPWDAEDEQAKAAIEILTAGEFSAFASYDVDETYQRVEMGIDYYKDGELVKNESQGSITLDGDGAKAGVAGFRFKDDEAAMGVSQGDDSISTISDIEVEGYVEKEIKDVAFAPMFEAQTIQDGKKIYLGIINSGSEETNTDILADSDDNSNLKGKCWLPYVIFSTQAQE